MKLLSSYFAAPVVLAALSFVAGCSSDAQSPAAGGAPAAGGSSSTAGSAGKGGSGGSSGAAAGAGAGAGASSGGAGGLGVAGSAGSSGSAGSTAGAGGGGTAVEASFKTIKTIIETSCFGNGCHSQEGNPLQMEIDDKLYATLNSHVTKDCGKLINVTSPADSAFVKVLLADCGNTPRMPYQECWDGDPQDSEQCISPANIEAIKAWIAKGAPQ